jgi:hypothetical protein
MKNKSTALMIGQLLELTVQKCFIFFKPDFDLTNYMTVGNLV